MPVDKLVEQEFRHTIDGSLATLPEPVRWVLIQARDEPHPVQRLWRICDTAEMVTRIVVAVAAADVRQSGWPEALDGRHLRELLVVPSLGSWWRAAKEISAYVPASGLFPEFRSISDLEVWLDGPGRKGSPLGVNGLRNLLAHAGGFSIRAAELLLAKHLISLKQFIGAFSVLSLIRLHVSRVDDDVQSHTPMWVRREGSDAQGLTVFPLLAFERPRRPRNWEFDLPCDEPTHHVYVRRDGEHHLALPIDSVLPLSELPSSARAAFRDLFPQRDGDDLFPEMAAAGHRIQGREVEIERAVDMLQGANVGAVFHLAGPAGSGKSALMAAVAARLSEQNQNVIAHYLRSGHRAATTGGLIGLITARLGFSTAEVDHQELLSRRLRAGSWFILLDGLDEVSPEEARSLIALSEQLAGAVWLISSRDLASVPGATPVLDPPELRGLSVEAVDAWLRSGSSPAIRSEILKLETPNAVGPDDSWTRYVAALIAGQPVGPEHPAASPPDWIRQIHDATDGYPLFIELYLRELDERREHVGGPLPKDFLVYFDRILGPLSFDDATALVPVVLQVLAESPASPSLDALCAVLESAGALSGGDDCGAGDTRLFVEAALRRAGSLIRRSGDRLSLYHQKLREYLHDKNRLPNARSVANSGLRKLARRLVGGFPQDLPVPVRLFVYDVGASKVPSEDQSLDRLLTDVQFLADRVRLGGLPAITEARGEIERVLGDAMYGRLPSEHQARCEPLRAALRFLRDLDAPGPDGTPSRARLAEATGALDELFLSIALAHGDDSVITRTARRLPKPRLQQTNVRSRHQRGVAHAISLLERFVVVAVALSYDGRFALIACECPSEDGTFEATVIRSDLYTRVETHIWKKPGRPIAVALSRSGLQAALLLKVAVDRVELLEFDGVTGRLRRARSLPITTDAAGHATIAITHADGETWHVAVGDLAGDVRLFVVEPESVHAHDVHVASPVVSLTQGVDGVAFVGLADGTVVRVELAADPTQASTVSVAARRTDLDGADETVLALAIARDGETLLCGWSDGAVSIVEGAAGLTHRLALAASGRPIDAISCDNDLAAVALIRQRQDVTLVEIARRDGRVETSVRGCSAREPTLAACVDRLGRSAILAESQQVVLYDLDDDQSFGVANRGAAIVAVGLPPRRRVAWALDERGCLTLLTGRRAIPQPPIDLGLQLRCIRRLNHGRLILILGENTDGRPFAVTMRIDGATPQITSRPVDVADAEDEINWDQLAVDVFGMAGRAKPASHSSVYVDGSVDGQKPGEPGRLLRFRSGDQKPPIHIAEDWVLPTAVDADGRGRAIYGDMGGRIVVLCRKRHNAGVPAPQD